MKKRISIFKHTFPCTWMDLVFTLAVVAFGSVMIIWPLAASKYLLIALGILVILTGGWQMAHYFRSKGRARLESNDFALGLSWICLGGLVVFARVEFGALLTYLFGLVLLVAAAFQVQNALRLRYMRFEKWTYHLIGVAISLGFGLLIIIDPFLPTRVIGLALVIEGILYLLSRIYFNRSLDACGQDDQPILNAEE